LLLLSFCLQWVVYIKNVALMQSTYWYKLEVFNANIFRNPLIPITGISKHLMPGEKSVISRWENSHKETLAGFCTIRIFT
jgi:hypothetical protein